MANMIVHLVAAVLICLFAGSKGETTEGYRTIVRPLIEECKQNVSFTDEDADAVLNMALYFPAGAKCLSDCCMHKLGMMRDGLLVPPEELVIAYKKLFADEPERMKDPLGVITACYNEVEKMKHSSSCEVSFHAVACSTIKTYGLQNQSSAGTKQQ